MKLLVTGGAGFIGSNLVRHLAERGDTVTVYDNFSTGQRLFLEPVLRRFPAVRIVVADLFDRATLNREAGGSDAIFHLAANADVRFGFEDPYRDLEQNVIATHNVLEAARLNGIRRLVFTSTSAAIGDPAVHPTPEDLPMPVQTSLYGASKAAAEGFVAAYAAGYGIAALVFRFVSILGPHYSHGHVFDFVKALRRDPARLNILGNGTQRKSYLHVDDCVGAVLKAFDAQAAERSGKQFALFNLGSEEVCTVRQSAGWIADELGLSPDYVFSGRDRGWIGDSPFVFLDISRIRSLGWSPSRGIEACVRETVRWLVANPWIFEARPGAARPASRGGTAEAPGG